jgi:hypothetical protein
MGVREQKKVGNRCTRDMDETRSPVF